MSKGISLAFSCEQIDHLRKRGYNMDDVFYLSGLAKESGKDVNTVAAMHAKGMGWGVLAKKIGVPPNDLNRLRVKLKNIQKEAVREEKKEKVKEQKTKRVNENNKFKINAPKVPRMEPMKGGGGRGRGK
ncbi:MAG: hypothetical protein ABIA67_00545 [Candidatus Margulisiibacteriota bacterium]